MERKKLKFGYDPNPEFSGSLTERSEVNRNKSEVFVPTSCMVLYSQMMDKTVRWYFAGALLGRNDVGAVDQATGGARPAEVDGTAFLGRKIGFFPRRLLLGRSSLWIRKRCNKSSAAADRSESCLLSFPVVSPSVGPSNFTDSGVRNDSRWCCPRSIDRLSTSLDHVSDCSTAQKCSSFVLCSWWCGTNWCTIRYSAEVISQKERNKRI